MRPEVPTPLALRLLDFITSVGRFFVMLAIVWVLAFGLIGAFGSANLRLSGHSDEVVVEHTHGPNGPVIRHDVSGHSAQFVTEPSPGQGVVPDDEWTSANVSIAVDDRRPQIVAFVAIEGLLVLALIALTNVRGIARSTMGGDTFTTANARRLRNIGLTALAYVGSGLLWPVLMNPLLDRARLEVPGFRVDPWVHDSWLWVIVGLLFLAVSRAFLWGVELQELEQATI